VANALYYLQNTIREGHPSCYGQVEIIVSVYKTARVVMFIGSLFRNSSMFH